MYLYHWTYPAALPSIRRYGLRPSRAAMHARRPGGGIGQIVVSVTFVARSPRAWESWAREEGRDVLLRFKGHREQATYVSGGAWTIRHAIPAAELEIHRGDRWMPVSVRRTRSLSSPDRHRSR